jgi:ribonuclease P protein component
MGQTFSKHERIYKRKEIQELFLKGSSFYLYPFSVKFSTSEEAANNSILVSVSKRIYKRAVDRNLLKRRIKEAYRLNKNTLAQKGFSVAFVYTSKKQHDFSFIEEKLIKVLEKLNQ